MIRIGDFNEMNIISRTDFGLKLDGQSFGDILLPNALVPPGIDLSKPLSVFVCYDSEDRLMATTEIPKAKVGQIALLKVITLSQVGAFLDWGLSKDLLLPFSEHLWDLRAGEEVLVHLYLDKTQRICASMKIEKILKKTATDLQEGQAVQIQIFDKTDLGFKAVVQGQYQGLLYSNEVFQRLEYGEKLNAFVRKIRDDGKVDINLMSTGHKAALGIEEVILQVLKDNNGFFSVNDKTAPEVIYRVFKASKKKFKIALGGLYKARKILITEEGIKLVDRTREVITQQPSQLTQQPKREKQPQASERRPTQQRNDSNTAVPGRRHVFGFDD